MGNPAFSKTGWRRFPPPHTELQCFEPLAKLLSRLQNHIPRRARHKQRSKPLCHKFILPQ
jgi:hypothetical protein